MTDTIFIRELEVDTFIGVPDEERASSQTLRISVDMEVASVREAARDDDLNLSVDYDAVAQHLRDLAALKPRKLIETLAEEMAEDILKSFAVEKVSVEIQKFILPDTECVGLRITRP